ncbi:MAG: PEGA domain-containing protein [Deltaproteobacteria bacterium]|nr:PEGA domain-containing protein [Deltaproteobacteria bacterium]
MRFTSSAHKGLALVLCAVLAIEWSGAAVFADSTPEPCLLLKFSDPSIPADLARERLEPLPRLLLRDLSVQWVSPPSETQAEKGLKELFLEPDDAALERISGRLAEAIRRMDRMETAEAARLLSEAEGQARTFRFGDATRPYFAEIFLRRGLLLLWEGNRGGAEEMFARSRVLRPDFAPDAGLFSPTFRDAWARAGDRSPPEAEILIHSIPPGATVYLDGKTAGTTPGRFKVSARGPVRVRLAYAGYRDVEKTGQWLPGDSEAVEWVLTRDRMATLGEILAASPDGKGSGPLLSELASACGASRVALIVLEDKGNGPAVRLFAARTGDAAPAYLGRFDWPAGDEGTAEAARTAARMLRDAGWPATDESGPKARTPWYSKWWFWAIMSVAAVGAAAGLAGGGSGGGSGSSTGTIGVTF